MFKFKKYSRDKVFCSLSMYSWRSSSVVFQQFQRVSFEISKWDATTQLECRLKFNWIRSWQTWLEKNNFSPRKDGFYRSVKGDFLEKRNRIKNICILCKWITRRSGEKRSLILDKNKLSNIGLRERGGGGGSHYGSAWALFSSNEFYIRVNSCCRCAN